MLTACFAAACGIWTGAHLSAWTEPEAAIASPPPTRDRRTETTTRWLSGRYARTERKLPVECPVDAATVLVLGQSNAANWAGERFDSRGQVFEFFEGTCYQATSPMLGADGKSGSIWPLVGDLMGRKVVFMTAAIAGTSSSEWADQAGPTGYLSKQLAQQIVPRYVIWMQGEADTASGTSALDYRTNVLRVISSVRAKHPGVAFFISQTTYCEGRQSARIRAAQELLVDPRSRIYAGPNTDRFVAPADRYDDCHLSAAGARKVAHAWAKALNAVDPQ